MGVEHLAASPATMLVLCFVMMFFALVGAARYPGNDPAELQQAGAILFACIFLVYLVTLAAMTLGLVVL
jgi:hypothetical protein